MYHCVRFCTHVYMRYDLIPLMIGIKCFRASQRHLRFDNPFEWIPLIASFSHHSFIFIDILIFDFTFNSISDRYFHLFHTMLSKSLMNVKKACLEIQNIFCWKQHKTNVFHSLNASSQNRFAISQIDKIYALNSVLHEFLCASKMSMHRKLKRKNTYS